MRAKYIFLKIFVVSLFEILLYYQAHKTMCLSSVCEREVIS